MSGMSLRARAARRSAPTGRRYTHILKPIFFTRFKAPCLDFVEALALWTGRRVEIDAHLGEGAQMPQMRYAVLGKINGIHHTIVITYRGAVVRIISARPSTEGEKNIHEKATQKKA